MKGLQLVNVLSINQWGSNGYYFNHSFQMLNLNTLLKSKIIFHLLISSREKTLFKCIAQKMGFSRWLSGKESVCQAGDSGSVPGSRRSSGEGNSSPLQNSCLGNPMNRGAKWATVHGVAKESDTTQQLNKNTTAEKQ